MVKCKHKQRKLWQPSLLTPRLQQDRTATESADSPLPLFCLYLWNTNRAQHWQEAAFGFSHLFMYVLVAYSLLSHSKVDPVRWKMAEGGFDPCECICTHEYAMRRLINLVSHRTEVLSPSLKILSEKLDFNSCIPSMQREVKNISSWSWEKEAKR